MERRADRPAARPLTDSERAFIGNAWLEDGLAEHASVASFARFALLAMKLGAPPTILAATADAMRDEIRHARLCFSVAARFLDREHGPGPLDIGSFDEADETPEAILASTIVEGCVGETIAAAMVAGARDAAVEPKIRALLTEIAEDEARHSALAWQFVGWMLNSRPGLSEAARSAFARGLSFPPDEPCEAPAIAADYGILPLNAKREIRKRTIERTILPRAAALFDLSDVGAGAQ